MRIEMPEHDPLSLVIKIVESRPLMNQDMSDLTWMDDLGLLETDPERNSTDSPSAKIFSAMLQRNEPLSVDEAAIMWN